MIASFSSINARMEVAIISITLLNPPSPGALEDRGVNALKKRPQLNK
jgi:hypothetical protein